MFLLSKTPVNPEYLEGLIAYLNQIEEFGIVGVQPDPVVVHLQCGTCDRKALSEVSQINHHNHTRGCPYCRILGNRLNKQVQYARCD